MMLPVFTSISVSPVWGSNRETRILYVKTVITKYVLSKYSELELILNSSNSKKNIKSVQSTNISRV